MSDSTPPSITGVTNGGTSGKATITFNEGIATLNGNAFLSGSLISATGTYKLIVTDNFNNVTVCDFSIVIFGDVNGNGLTELTDLIAVKRHLLKMNLLHDVYKKAGDIDSNGEISISDLIAVKKYVLGVITTFD